MVSLCGCKNDHKPHIHETPGHSTRCWSKTLSRLFYPGTAAHPLHSAIDPSKPINDFLNIVGLSISVTQMKKSNNLLGYSIPLPAGVSAFPGLPFSTVGASDIDLCITDGILCKFNHRDEVCIKRI